MTCILSFCERLDATPGEHACELASGHAEACRCECSDCLLLTAGGAAGLDQRATS